MLGAPWPELEEELDEELEDELEDELEHLAKAAPVASREMATMAAVRIFFIWIIPFVDISGLAAANYRSTVSVRKDGTMTGARRTVTGAGRRAGRRARRRTRRRARALSGSGAGGDEGDGDYRCREDLFHWIFLSFHLSWNYCHLCSG